MKAISEFMREYFVHNTLQPWQERFLESMKGRPMGAAIFGGQCPTTAKIEATLMDGSKYAVETYVEQMDLGEGKCSIYDTGRQRFTLSGFLKDSIIFTPAEPVKPVKAKKIKPPTVKASAARLRKADKAAAALAKRESVLEAALRVTKLKKEEAQKERKLASEALVTSAVA
jgi:hypothetical protein